MSLHLHVSDSVIDGKSRIVTTLTEDGHPPIEVFHEFDGIMPRPENPLLDGNILCVLHYAMSRGKPFRVHGAVSRTILRNMEELQSAWVCWHPERYKKTEIIPDRIVDARPNAGKNKAIAAFSGGVDASFTAIRHAKTAPENTRYPVADVLMVHGFDVALEHPEYFDQLITRTRPFLDALNLRLHTVRTNSKILRVPEWPHDSHAAELAGCLHMFSDEFEYGLIGSSEPYDALIFPYSSNPATDHLLSGGQLTIVHDGAGYSRTDKVAGVAQFPIALRTLKVCWALGVDQSRNCGKCEKCIRTHLNFLAAGYANPPCFPEVFDIRLIRTLGIYTEGQMAELAGIVKYAKIKRVTGDWLEALEKRLSKGFTHYGHGPARRLATSMLAAIGLKRPVKHLWYKLKHLQPRDRRIS